MESTDLLLIYPDPARREDEASGLAAPGFEARDFMLLRRALFWPGLLSLSLACVAVLQGMATS